MNPILTRLLVDAEKSIFGIVEIAAPAKAVVLIKSRLLILLDIYYSMFILFQIRSFSWFQLRFSLW